MGKQYQSKKKKIEKLHEMQHEAIKKSTLQEYRDARNGKNWPNAHELVFAGPPIYVRGWPHQLIDHPAPGGKWIGCHHFSCTIDRTNEIVVGNL